MTRSEWRSKIPIMSLEKTFNKAVILTGACALTLNPALGAGIIVLGVGARALKEARTMNDQDGSQPQPEKLNSITVEPNGDIIEIK